MFIPVNAPRNCGIALNGHRDHVLLVVRSPRVISGLLEQRVLGVKTGHLFIGDTVSLTQDCLHDLVNGHQKP